MCILYVQSFLSMGEQNIAIEMTNCYFSIELYWNCLTVSTYIYNPNIVCEVIIALCVYIICAVILCQDIVGICFYLLIYYYWDIIRIFIQGIFWGYRWVYCIGYCPDIIWIFSGY